MADRQDQLHSSNNHRRRMERTQWLISAVLPATAFIFAVLALWLWYTKPGEEPQILVPASQSDEELMTQANIVLERANDAVNSAELVLSFLEGASVIITIAIAAAAVVGLSSINELREAIDETENELLERVEEAEARLLVRERQLANMEDLLAEAEARIDRVVNERLQQVYADTESARRQSTALAHHTLAEQLLHEKNIDAALNACKEAHKLDPENYANNYLYGMILLEKGDFNEAIVRLEESQAVKADFTPATAALGLANRRAGDLVDDRRQRNELYNIAEARLLEAMEREPALLTYDGESYYGTLGSLYRRQGRIGDALDSYRRAAEVTPRRSYPFVNLAMLYMSQEEGQLLDQNLIIAERNAARRFADTPTDYWALYDLGMIALVRGEMDQSRQFFQDAIEVTPASVSVYYSVVARLEFLESVVPELPGLKEIMSLLDTQIQRIGR